jgi:hypothetical protein
LWDFSQFQYQFIALLSAHTRTSLLRQLGGKGGQFDEPVWLLPETRALFIKQAERQKQLVDGWKKIQYALIIIPIICFSTEENAINQAKNRKKKSE